MRSRRSRGRAFMLLSAAVLWCAGCGSGGSTPAGSNSTPASPVGGGAIKSVDTAKLPPVEEYLGVALDVGRVRIAPPAEWDRAPQSTKYLATFYRAQVPRIIITAEDSPYTEFDSVTQANVESFAQAVKSRLSENEAKVIESPLPMVIGSNAFARYVTREGVYKSVPLEHQMLVTVFDRRLYQIELIVIENRIIESRDFAYAVAGALRFEKPGTATEFPALELSGESDEAKSLPP